MKINYFTFFFNIIIINAFKNRNFNSNFCSTNLLIMRGSKQEKSISKLYTLKTENQKQYYNYLNNDNVNIVVCSGPAGSGKTALACHYAIEKYKKGECKRIVITRPLITADEDIGFLPGTMNKKMEPWTRPMIDIFNEYYPMSIINNMIKEGIIEVSPLAFMRGRTFKDAIIIADEMQNSSPNQMLMVLTRIGDNSKLIINGDMKQTDTLNSGLNNFLTTYKEKSDKINTLSNFVKIIELNNTDIVRHHVVSKILEMYNFDTPSVLPVESLQRTYVERPPSFYVSNTENTLETSPFRIFNSTIINKYTNDCALIPKKDMNIIKKYSIWGGAPPPSNP